MDNKIGQQERLEQKEKETFILDALYKLQRQTSAIKEDFYQIARYSGFWVIDNNDESPGDLLNQAILSLHHSQDCLKKKFAQNREQYVISNK